MEGELGLVPVMVLLLGVGHEERINAQTPQCAVQPS